MSTTAVLSDDGAHWVLNGEKLWCTNGTVAELMVVMARTGPKKITAFIVEADWPGVEVVQRLHFMGLKGIENGIIRFTNVKVPVENVLWGEGKRPQARAGHAQHRPAHAAGLGGGRRQARRCRSAGSGQRRGCSGASRSASTTRSPRRSAGWRPRPSRWRR